LASDAPRLLPFSVRTRALPHVPSSRHGTEWPNPQRGCVGHEEGSVRILVGLFGILLVLVLSGVQPWVGFLTGGALCVGFILFRLRKIPTTALAALFGRSRPSTALQIAEVSLGCILLLLATGAQGVNLERDSRKAANRASHQALLEHNRVTTQKVRETLIAQLPSTLASWRQSLAKAEELVAGERFDDAQAILTDVTAKVASYRDLSRPEVAAFEAEKAALAAKIEPMVAVRREFEDAKATMVLADEAKAEERFVTAEEALNSAISKLKGIDPASAAKLRLAPGPLIADAERRLRQVRKAAQREREAGETVRIKAEATAAVCGEKPKNSSWDGAIIGLERFIKANAHDPESVEIDGCTEATMTEEECWVFRCKVRAKNAFGAKILQMKTFKKNFKGFRELE
jgi:hypothetical protein